MKNTLLLGLLTVMACNATQNQAPPITKTPLPTSITYASTITRTELKEHLFIYASDEYEGRETGKPGQKKAVEYLRNAYSALKVPAAKANGDYFQKVPLEIAQLPSGTMLFNDQVFEIGEDFLAFIPFIKDFSEVVYAGYGIESENYSDFKDLDVQGKIVLIKAGEPVDEDGTYLVNGTKQRSEWSDLQESIERKSEILVEKGAGGILYYDPVNYQRYVRAYEFLANSEDGMMRLKEEGQNPAPIPVSAKLAKMILAEIETDHRPKRIPAKVSFNLESRSEQIDSENVVAVIKGSEKPDEYVVISSHLDHIGVTADGKINNGADDDGSGSVAMLEIAEAFQMAADAGQGPARSVVFLHVTGEEKGLLGSAYYTDVDPIFPLEGTVVNLNIDMIGRIDPKREGSREYVYLIGSDKLSTELHELSEEVNEEFTQLELDYTYNDENDPNRFYYRSDHYNFAKNNIPIIFYFNGTHEDYHRPTDTPDKINYDLLEKRAQLIFHTAWELANRDTRVVVDKVSR